MRRTLFALPFALALALAGLVAPTSAAHAQVDPNLRSYGVYQRDQLVAEIYREDTSPTHYTEHWVLSPAYVYPSDTNGVTAVIRSSDRAYTGLADFFARVPWSPGSRHVEATCDDGDTLPVRR